MKIIKIHQKSRRPRNGEIKKTEWLIRHPKLINL